MASYAVNAGEIAAHDKTLTAATVDTVTLTDAFGAVEVLTDGASAVYVSVDGSTPTVSGAKTYRIPASGTQVRTIALGDGPVSGALIKLISTGTPTYSVTGLRNRTVVVG